MKENWQQVKEIFAETLSQRHENRLQFISQKCSGNQELENEVKSLLISYDSAETFLESPAIAEIAESFVAKTDRLESGSFLNHYKIIKQIGKGGMGEVYLAEDTKLERKVALKILNNFFDSEHINIKRFVLEAKAASSLNHPNIVVIHEVGETNGTHYIVGEYINGRTLNEIMHSKTLSLSEIIDISVQIVNALSAAHELGIIHRDIKPDNIMFREDGIVKILDFGLAKLTDKPSGEIDYDQKTREQMNTRSGMILGTTNYMSPEQARGIAIDTRTDIWSFGVVFYELLTRRLPFEGETTSDIIASVLRAEPAPLSESGAAFPQVLENIVFKCLQKDPVKRYQTADEILTELKTFKRELEYRARTETFEFRISDQVAKEKLTDAKIVRNTADESPHEDSGKKFEPEKSNSYINQPPPPSYFPRALTWMALAFAAFSVVGFYSWSKFSSSSAPVISFSDMKFAKLTYEGTANSVTSVSPDGKYISYVSSNGGKQALMLRQVNGAGVVEIVPMDEVNYGSITFSSDGSSIFYTMNSAKSPAQLFEIPILGGTPRKIIDNLGTSFACSPDGKTIAFVRNQTSLFLADSNGSSERLLAKSAAGDIRILLAWRPDGRTLMTTVDSAKEKTYLSEISIDDGKEKRLATPSWIIIRGIKWLSDGSGLLISGRDLEAQFSQIWLASYPSGETKRITNDLSNYFGMSLTADNKSLVTTKEERLYNIWEVQDGKTEKAKRITIGEGRDEGISGLDHGLDDNIVYTVRTAGKFDLWTAKVDGSGNRQLTNNSDSNSSPVISPDGKLIVFASNHMGNTDLWRMNIDGSNPVQLTNSPIEGESQPTFTPDGKWLLYTKTDSSNFSTIWKLNLEDGTSNRLTEVESFEPRVSPDGKSFACVYLETKSKQSAKVYIIPIDGGTPLRILDFPLLVKSVLRWSADSKAFIYVDRSSRVHNIWMQPIDGSPAKQMTFFESGQILKFSLMRDGKSFLLSRGNESADVIQITGFR